METDFKLGLKIFFFCFIQGLVCKRHTYEGQRVFGPWRAAERLHRKLHASSTKLGGFNPHEPGKGWTPLQGRWNQVNNGEAAAPSEASTATE